MNQLKKTYSDKDALEHALSLGIIDFRNEDFSQIDLSGMEFPEGCDFTGAAFTLCDMRSVTMERCVFRGATLFDVRGSYANFTGSNFFEASADRADFTHANFSSCDFRSFKVHRAVFDEQLLPWMHAVIEYGIRVPVYRVEALGD